MDRLSALSTLSLAPVSRVPGIKLMLSPLDAGFVVRRC